MKVIRNETNSASTIPSNRSDVKMVLPSFDLSMLYWLSKSMEALSAVTDKIPPTIIPTMIGLPRVRIPNEFNSQIAAKPKINGISAENNET